MDYGSGVDRHTRSRQAWHGSHVQRTAPAKPAMDAGLHINGCKRRHRVSGYVRVCADCILLLRPAGQKLVCARLGVYRKAADSYESLTSRIGRLWLMLCGFNFDYTHHARSIIRLRRGVGSLLRGAGEILQGGPHLLQYKVIVGNFNVKIGPRRSLE
ncbi:unnamed protein product [Heligmosomoides polygyrus]|uniref:Reverse transcriptase n=1 Tax=Heligmosomoides polygyrus TaxID=6339 RepID=A0A183G3V1_HELPZ|nr:unnamed protein product [Heligmosomoides polygyrus]